MLFDRLHDFLRKNGRDLTIFAASLLLSFGVWLVYNLTLNYTKVVSVPIIALSNIDGHKQESSNTATVLARCHTRGFDLRKLDKASEGRPIEVTFNASDLHCKSGELYYITATELNRYVTAIFGDKAGMEAFVTDSLFFRFQFENSKKVPVCPVYSLTCEPQYTTVHEMRMTPDSVIVYGEPYHIENIDRVYTKPFSLEGLKNTAHGEVKLEQVKGVRLSAESSEYMIRVQRYVEIEATMQIRTRNVPVNKTMVVYPSTAKVHFKCAFPVTVEPENDIHFYIDYNDFQNSLGGKCIPKYDALPEDVLDFRMDPEIFECVESDR